MSSLNPSEMQATLNLIEKLNAITHYGECDDHEVYITGVVATVQPPRPEYLAEDQPLPRPTTEVFLIYEDGWRLAEINHFGGSKR